jgi:hypothetical protein
VPAVHGRIPAAILILIVAGAFLFRLRLIDRSMPYPAHLDEAELADPAANILRTGDWNPHQFEYPTLPIYLVTASFAAGYLDACATKAVKRVADIGSVSFPYYTHRRVVRPARALFAFLSVVSIGLCGLIGYRLSQDPRVLLVAPLLLCSSVSYLELSWRYLNVDIVGCFFVTALLAFLFENWGATHPRFDAPRSQAPYAAWLWRASTTSSLRSSPARWRSCSDHGVGVSPRSRLCWV